jgi:hypothetical protein
MADCEGETVATTADRQSKWSLIRSNPVIPAKLGIQSVWSPRLHHWSGCPSSRGQALCEHDILDRVFVKYATAIVSASTKLSGLDSR